MSVNLLNGLRRVECCQLREMMRQAAVSGVYGLVDPDDPDFVRYVGSSRHLAKRLSDHAFNLSAKQDSERRAWVRGMREAGRTPVMVVLEELDAQKASFEMHYAERNWIERFRLIGHADFNRILLSEEREFLIAQVKKLSAENAELRKSLLQRATQRENLRCVACAEIQNLQRNATSV